MPDSIFPLLVFGFGITGASITYTALRNCFHALYFNNISAEEVYVVNLSTKGEGVKNPQNLVNLVYECLVLLYRKAI